MADAKNFPIEWATRSSTKQTENKLSRSLSLDSWLNPDLVAQEPSNSNSTTFPLTHNSQGSFGEFGFAPPPASLLIATVGVFVAVPLSMEVAASSLLQPAAKPTRKTDRAKNRSRVRSAMPRLLHHFLEWVGHIIERSALVSKSRQ